MKNEDDKSSVDRAKEKLRKIAEVVLLAEEWSDDQVMPESNICMAALKDIRRIVRS